MGKPGSGGGKDVSRMMEKTDMPGDDYNITHYPANTDPSKCQAACDADEKCRAWTYVIRGSPAGSGDCCLKSSVPCPVTSSSVDSSCTSGSKTAQNLPSCGVAGSSLACNVHFTPSTNVSSPFNEVGVSCGKTQDTLRLLPTERTVEIRAFLDHTFVEVFFQSGRTAMTAVVALDDEADVALQTTGPVKASATAYPIRSIWTTPENVRNAPRVYH